MTEERPLPGGWRLRVVESVSSTQDAVIAAAMAGIPDRYAVCARVQTAGRGRAGRLWKGAEGNLHLSVLLRSGPRLPFVADLSLRIGVALHDGVAAVVLGREALRLKWPNDLLLADRKLGGILIETSLAPGGVLEWAVVGVGVNLAHAPPLVDRATACLAERGVNADPLEVATLFLAALDRWLEVSAPVLRAEWLARAHPLGTRLRVEAGGRVLEGEFAGLSDAGELLLAGCETGLRSADVWLAPAQERG